MDIEGISIIVITAINGLVILYLAIRLIFFYKMDKKNYDDLMKNIDHLKKEEPNDYFLGDGGS